MSRQGALLKKLFGHSDVLASLNILIVGVGGIGCEVLKVLSKFVLKGITIVDMDTIELTNLNRQFLFKPEHRGASKALIAREVLLQINPSLPITAHCCSIQQLPISQLRTFDCILMALDNLDARFYVNRVGVRLSIPIIDAGTLGYTGNVSFIDPPNTKCYACDPKNQHQKVYPVCTIRMRPQKPIHCVVWAKMLFQALFSHQQAHSQVATDQESEAILAQNDMMDMSELSNQSVKVLLANIFNKQILNIKNSKQLTQGSSITPIDQQEINEVAKVVLRNPTEDSLETNTHRVTPQLSPRSFLAHDLAPLPLHDHLTLLIEAHRELNERTGLQSFEKDDDMIMHFISSAANLRMHCFGINQISFNQVKDMAGNIVPAIASTNSIVSGLQVLELLKWAANVPSRNYFVQNQPQKISPVKVELPSKQCQICSVKPLILRCNFNSFTFGKLLSIVKDAVKKQFGEIAFSINVGQNQLYNSDQPRQESLEQMLNFFAKKSQQLDFSITDEDEMVKVGNVWAVHSDQISEQNCVIENWGHFERQIVSSAQQEPSKPSEDDSSDCEVMDQDQVVQCGPIGFGIKRPSSSPTVGIEGNKQPNQ